MFKFYLGVHRAHWLAKADVPLFVSARQLRPRKSYPRATCDWALDSGGFTELTMHGRWTVTPAQYVAEVQKWSAEVGRLGWAAIQDWMCEEVILAKTGLTVTQHQGRTVANYLELQQLAPEQPWVPVLQGWEPDDYRRHVDMYTNAGVDLSALERVGIGSVCRRQHTLTVCDLVLSLAAAGLKLHAFGFKRTGLARVWQSLASSDSMSWSYQARRNKPLPGHEHTNCANCLDYALQWQQGLLSRLT